MGLFKSVGRRAERLKQQFSSDDENYGCMSCVEVLEENYEACPHCGSDEVVVVE